MANDMGNNEGQEIEDYSGPEGNEGGSQSGQGSGNQGNQGGQGGEGQFGEFGNTGVGTDLTIEMENTDVRTGMVKGGEQGADDAAGPGQYGGEAGGLSK